MAVFSNINAGNYTHNPVEGLNSARVSIREDLPRERDSYKNKDYKPSIMQSKLYTKELT
ncbi:hypothetical protein ACFLWT_01910 [Chloroflexota bacterium]